VVKESSNESVRLLRNNRYKRFILEQKRQFIEEAQSVGNTISSISRKYGLAPSCLYEWRRQMEEGGLVGLKSGEPLVPLSELKALKAKVRDLERMVGKKTVEVEILKEAVELGREKKLISRAPLQGVEGFK
jgi:transposase